MNVASSEVAELLAMVLGVAALLFLANRLSAYGVFDYLPLARQSLGPLLVAVAPCREAKPGLNELMSRVSFAAHARGVEEERSVLGDEVAAVTRGELVGVYHAAAGIRPFMRASPAELGVVLDVGENRVHEENRAAWVDRLAKLKEDLGEISVKIIDVGDALCVPAMWKGRPSELVGQWRSYRKLLKHWNRLPSNERKGAPNVLIETMSNKRSRVLAVLPVDCTKSIYRS